MQIKRVLKYGLSGWKDHPGYVGRYQVSVDGEVREAPSEEGGWWWKLFHPKRDDIENMRISKSRRHRHGIVRLYSSESCTDRFVDHLVLEAFVGPCPANKECYHLDGDASNNSIENLSWKTKLRVLS
jgi:hypothetical protein